MKFKKEKPNYNFKDETGNKYGYLTVIERAPNNKAGRAMWKCQCQCGNIVVVVGKSLRSGNTKSCGCYQKERAIESNMNRAENLIGKRFGKLKILEEAGFKTKNSGKRSRQYKCLCDCGNYFIAEHAYLAFGDTTSCGCICSKGEYQIEQLLKKHNISYEREFSFPDLKHQLPLRFDFAIFKNGKLIQLIEYQGEQHYIKSNGFYNEDLVRNDKLKAKYCKKNKIKLKYIYYERRHNILWEELGLEGIK